MGDNESPLDEALDEIGARSVIMKRSDAGWTVTIASDTKTATATHRLVKVATIQASVALQALMRPA